MYGIGDDDDDDVADDGGDDDDLVDDVDRGNMACGKDDEHNNDDC